MTWAGQGRHVHLREPASSSAPCRACWADEASAWTCREFPPRTVWRPLAPEFEAFPIRGHTRRQPGCGNRRRSAGQYDMSSAAVSKVRSAAESKVSSATDSDLSSATPSGWRRAGFGHGSSPSTGGGLCAESRSECTTSGTCWSDGRRRQQPDDLRVSGGRPRDGR